MSLNIVATTKPWNILGYQKHAPTLPGKWHLITAPELLTIESIASLAPRYIFFPHWSWVVPAAIRASAECVCFHMTDVPYGRGGSPLQNLITRGHKETTLSALRMVEEMDAGPVYLKTPLSLEGRAQDIFERTAELVYQSIAHIVRTQPEPVPQEGPIVRFSRRTPDMSRLPDNADLEAIYDHIRMLDADTYPRAFVEYGPFRLSFSHAQFQGDDTLSATVNITMASGEDS